MRPAFAGDPVANTLFVSTVVAWMFFETRQAEAALSNALGDKYTIYANRRKRIIPFVW